MEWEFSSDIVPGKPLPCNSFVTVILSAKTVNKSKKTIKETRKFRIPRRFFGTDGGKYAIASMNLMMLLTLDKVEDRLYEAQK